MRKYETPTILISTNVSLNIFDHIVVTLKSSSDTINFQDPEITEDNEICIKLTQEQSGNLGRNKVLGQWTGITSDDNRIVSEMFALSISSTLYDEVI